MCLFYECSSRRSCIVKLAGVRGAKRFTSKHGWLFIRRNNDYLFFNPLTLEEIFLPKFLTKSSSRKKIPAKSFGSSACQVGTFSSCPSSQNCVVVLLSSRDTSTIHIASCRLTANKWVMTTIKLDTHHMSCDSALLPSPRFVFFKAIKDVSRHRKHANHANNINSTLICYDNHFLYFDFLRRYKIENMHPLEGVEKSFDADWYSKFKEVHSDDWICKFGKEFTFSFCLFHDFKRVSNKLLFGYRSCDSPNVPVIKATWLYNV